MEKCKLCSRRIFSNILDQDGYCPTCSKALRESAERKAREGAIADNKRRDNATWIDSLPSYEIIIPETPYKRQTGYEPFIFSNITSKGKYDSEIVVFDTETTGLSPNKDRIIEIGAIKYMNGVPVEKFHSYVNPECHIPENVSKINHITDDMVAEAPTIGQVLPSFDDFVGSAIIVAHNLEFDLKFIFYSGSKVLDIKRKYIDTLDQARRIIKKSDIDNYKLNTLCEYYGFMIPNIHSALADAFGAGRLFYELVSEKQDFNFALKPPAAVHENYEPTIKNINIEDPKLVQEQIQRPSTNYIKEDVNVKPNHLEFSRHSINLRIIPLIICIIGVIISFSKESFLMILAFIVLTIVSIIYLKNRPK